MTKTRRKRRLLSVLMVIAMLPAMTVPAHASERNMILLQTVGEGTVEFENYTDNSTVKAGTEIKVKVTPAEGYVFTRYRAGNQGTTGTTYYMDQPYTAVSAGTKEITYTVPESGNTFLNTWIIQAMFQPELDEGEYYITPQPPRSLTFADLPAKAKAGDKITFSSPGNGWFYMSSAMVTPEAYEMKIAVICPHD